MTFLQFIAGLPTWQQVFAALTLVVFVWQSFTPELRADIEKRVPHFAGFMRLLVALLPAVRDAVLATKWQIVLGIPKADVLAQKDDPKPPPPPGPGPALGLLILSVVMFLGALALAGCPVYTRSACGSPRAFACTEAGVPRNCSVSGRWTEIGDEPCSAQGSTCAISDAGRAYCLAEGGVPQ